LLSLVSKIIFFIHFPAGRYYSKRKISCTKGNRAISYNAERLQGLLKKHFLPLLHEKSALI
jgi:hypothetical protein